MVIMVPGLGGTSTTKDFTDFYDSGGRRGAATLLGFVLVVGCWLMVWLFTELRATFATSVRSDVAARLSVIAAAAVMIGAAVELGPTMVQNNSDNSDFVGVPIAHAFTQAGAGAVIIGLFTFAAAVLLCGLEFRRTTAYPRWLGTLSIVFAILLIGSFFALPGFLLPIWAIVVGIAGRGDNAPAVPASS
jgi:threonine/homoserine/homoserine lactone efflux protein